jgi:hypothetical protein
MKKLYFYMMTAMMALTMASCSNWDSTYYDTPYYIEDIVGSWVSEYGGDSYGEYGIYGYDVVYYDFFNNHTGRYTYYSAFGWDYVDFDWDTRGNRLFIRYYDGDYENLYYGFDSYNYLILSLDPYFYQYTAYAPNGRYYEPAKTMDKAPAKQSTDMVTKRDDNAKLKSLSRGVIVRDTE